MTKLFRKRMCSFLFPILFSSCLSAGCSFAGSMKTPQEALGLPNYGKPPAVTVSKSIFGAKASLSTDVNTSVDELTFDPQTNSFKITKGKFTSNVTPLLQQLGATADALAKEGVYKDYLAAHMHENDNQKEEVLAGIAAGEKLGEAVLPVLGQLATATPAMKSGLVSGLLSSGIGPKQLFALASELNTALTPAKVTP